ncbi:MAG: hypothetical protein ACLT2T_10865 [Bilophila wadsworthia]
MPRVVRARARPAAAIGTSVIGGMLVATLARHCSCPSSSAGSQGL